MGRLLKCELDVRELILQRENIEPFHQNKGGRRLRPSELADNYYLNEDSKYPYPSVIGLFDDVLTTGSHFKAAKLILGAAFPDIPIKGFFIARRVSAPSGDEVTDNEDYEIWE